MGYQETKIEWALRTAYFVSNELGHAPHKRVPSDPTIERTIATRWEKLYGQQQKDLRTALSTLGIAIQDDLVDNDRQEPPRPLPSTPPQRTEQEKQKYLAAGVVLSKLVHGEMEKFGASIDETLAQMHIEQLYTLHAALIVREAPSAAIRRVVQEIESQGKAPRL